MLSAACGGPAPASPAAPAQPSSPTAPTPVPPTPTSWAIRGSVVSSTDFVTPISGAVLTYGTDAPVTTDASGVFTILTTDNSTKPLTIASPGYLLRETSLTGGEAKTGLVFDLIALDPKFPHDQYREMVRNTYQGTAVEPSRHWTSNPNLFVWTTWTDTGLPVNPAGIESIVSDVRRAIPQWSGGRLQLGLVEMSATNRPRQKGWINLQFNRSGNWSLLGEDPGWVQLGFDHTCGSLGVVHEFGHAMGYWHTRVTPSIMGGGPGACRPFDLTPNEMMIARAMYARDPGNLEHDKDGPPPAPPRYQQTGVGFNGR